MFKSDRYDSILPFSFYYWFLSQKTCCKYFMVWLVLEERRMWNLNRVITQIAKGSMISYTMFNQNFFQKSHKAFENDVSYVLTIAIDWIPGKIRFIYSRSKALLLSLYFHEKLKKITYNLHLQWYIRRSLYYGNQRVVNIYLDTQRSCLLKTEL